MVNSHSLDLLVYHDNHEQQTDSRQIFTLLLINEDHGVLDRYIQYRIMKSVVYCRKRIQSVADDFIMVCAQITRNVDMTYNVPKIFLDCWILSITIFHQTKSMVC